MKRTQGYREYTGEDIEYAPSRAKERRLEYDEDAVPETTTLEWRMRDARLNPVVQCQTEIKRLEGINAHLVQQLREARRECEAIREDERRRAEQQARMYIASEVNPVVQCQTEIKRLEGINAHLVQQLGEARRECEATVGAIREHERRQAERQARMYIASEVRRLIQQHEQSRGEMNTELRRLHNRLLRR